LWLSAGQVVHVLTRSATRAAQLASEGFQPVVGDVTSPHSLAALGALDVETLLYAVGFDRSAGHSFRQVYVDGLRAVLAALSHSSPQQAIYISSTGVYGDAAGDWVDESTPCHPERENGQACLSAEELLRQSSLGPRATILRLAGIYGPGRIPNRAALVAGEPIQAPTTGWLNLIHVEDAAAIVLAVERLQAANPAPRLYLVSDGQPALRPDYYAELARLYQAPAPRFTAPAPGDPAASRAAGSKRISPARLMHDLGPAFRLTYPSYREGLRQAADATGA
jgi:nucleoside-diphosphate-sugar epimerase